MYLGSSYEKRVLLVREMINNPIYELSLRESYRHLYHFWMFEATIRLEKKLRRLGNRHRDKLNQDVKVWNFRAELKNQE